MDGGVAYEVAPALGWDFLLVSGEGLPRLFRLCAGEAALMKEEPVALGEGLAFLDFYFGHMFVFSFGSIVGPERAFILKVLEGYVKRAF